MAIVEYDGDILEDTESNDKRCSIINGKLVFYNKSSWSLINEYIDGFQRLKYIGNSIKPDQPKGFKDLSFLFINRRDLKTLDLSDWDMSEVESTEGMFYGCINLKEIIGIENWVLPNIIFMDNMFYNCKSLVNKNIFEFRNYVKDSTRSNYLKYQLLKTCNHTYHDGSSSIEYDSNYERRNSEMHCNICKKEGTREELENDRITKKVEEE